MLDIGQCSYSVIAEGDIENGVVVLAQNVSANHKHSILNLSVNPHLAAPQWLAPLVINQHRAVHHIVVFLKRSTAPL